jgi:hypothetical protein
MLAQLGAAGDGESEEELHGLLETMMSQLMSKEVLYEPLKELHDKVGFLFIVFATCMLTTPSCSSQHT